MKYYIYAHYCNGEIVYIGKGTGDRWKFDNERNPSWQQFYAKNKELMTAEILEKYDNEADAISAEAEAIEKHWPSLNILKAREEKQKRLTLFVPEPSLLSLKRCAMANNTNMSEIVRNLIADYVEAHKPPF